jgi:hypothetical protein
MPSGARTFAGVTLLTVDVTVSTRKTPGQTEAARAFHQCQKFRVTEKTKAELRDPGSSQ